MLIVTTIKALSKISSTHTFPFSFSLSLSIANECTLSSLLEAFQGFCEFRGDFLMLFVSRAVEYSFVLKDLF